MWLMDQLYIKLGYHLFWNVNDFYLSDTMSINEVHEQPSYTPINPDLSHKEQGKTRCFLHTIVLRVVGFSGGGTNLKIDLPKN